MKRYVVFSGDRSYAAGGALDYTMDFSVRKQALSYRDRLCRHDKWAHVWDTKTHTILPNVVEDDAGYSGGITGEA